LHVCVIPSIALFETSASERNALPIPHSFIYYAFCQSVQGEITYRI
jgi:hypothetical protein